MTGVGGDRQAAPSPAQLYEKTRPLTERIDEILDTPCDSLADEAKILKDAYAILNAELR